EEIAASFPARQRNSRNAFALRVQVPHDGVLREIGLVPDFVFGLIFPDGSRRCFMVEIDRGTMPISRSDFRQTSFELKMRTYLSAHAAKLHERNFGWKTLRVLAGTTEPSRMPSIVEA